MGGLRYRTDLKRRQGVGGEERERRKKENPKPRVRLLWRGHPWCPGWYKKTVG